MVILQLHSPIPILADIYHDGTFQSGIAHFLIDYGIEHHLYWVIALDENGQCWTVQNPYIRFQTNITFGRFKKEETE